jgi:hypothetical protein
MRIHNPGFKLLMHRISGQIIRPFCDIRYPAGYQIALPCLALPDIRYPTLTGYPVSGFWINRISGKNGASLFETLFMV